MTYENALKKIETAFESVDASKLANMAVQVTLSDEDCGGTFYFKSENGKIEVEGYDYHDNDAVIDIARKALMDILAGKTTLDAAIEKGVATAKGDFAKLDTLKNAIPKYVAPAKKSAAKKEEAPKKRAKKGPKKVEIKNAEPKNAEAKSPEVQKTETKKTVEKKPVAKKIVKKV